MANIYKVTKEQYDALVSGKGINCNNVVFTYDEAAVYDVVDYAGIAYSIKRDGDIIQLLGDDQVLSQLSIEEVSEAKHAINATRALGLHYANNNDVTTYYDNDGNLITKFAGSNGLAYTGMRIGEESVGLYTINGNSTHSSFKASYTDAEINATDGICLNSNYTSVAGQLSVYDDATDHYGYRPTSNFGSETDTDVYFYGTGIAVYGNDTDATYQYSYPAKSGTFAMTSDLLPISTLTASTNLNTLTTEGEYRTTATSTLRSLTNAPDACAGSSAWAGEGNLIVKSFGIGNTSYVYQEFIAKGGTRTETYKRVLNDSTWGSWEMVATSGDIPTNYVTTNTDQAITGYKTFTGDVYVGPAIGNNGATCTASTFSSKNKAASMTGVNIVSGAQDVFYCANQRTDFWKHSARCGDHTFTDWESGCLYNGIGASGLYFLRSTYPITDSTPLVIQICSGDETSGYRAVDHTDVMSCMLHTHTFAKNQYFLTKYKVEVLGKAGYDSTDPLPADQVSWYTIIEKDNVHEDVEGLTFKPDNASVTGTSYVSFRGLRITIYGVDTTDTYWRISEIQMLNQRGAGAPATAVGALPIAGGTVYGEIKGCNVSPRTNGSYSLGDNSYRWGAAYINTIYENGTALNQKYLGKTATAADSSKLNGQEASYYLNVTSQIDYNNLSNKPFIPTQFTDISNRTTNYLSEPTNTIGGDTTLTFRSNVADTRGNRFFGLTADRVTIEESLDAGTTWTFRDVAAVTKQGLFDDPIGQAIAMPKNAEGKHTTNAMLRITCSMANFGAAASSAADSDKLALWNHQNFLGNYIYCNIDRFYAYVGGPVFLNITLQTAPAPESGAAPVWTDRMTITRACGWNGGNVAASNSANFVFGGNYNQSPLVRVIVRTCDSEGGYDDTKVSTDTSNMYLFSLAAFGPTIWGSTNPVQKYGTPIQSVEGQPDQFYFWGNLYSSADNVYNLGSSSNKWNSVYATAFNENGTWLYQKYAQISHTHELSNNPVYSLVNQDTRSTNPTPSSFFTNDSTKRSLTVDFKSIGAIDTPFTTGSYCNLFTSNQWTDASGGYPSQIAVGEAGIAVRHGTSGTAWSTWEQVITGDLATINDLTNIFNGTRS